MTVGWEPVPKALRGRSSTTVHVYFVLACYANGDRVAWPSLPTIAGEVRCRRAAVSASLRELVELGLLKIERAEGKPNKYRLTRIPRERGTRVRGEPTPGSRGISNPAPTGATNLDLMNENARARVRGRAREDAEIAYHWIDELRRRGLVTSEVFQ